MMNIQERCAAASDLQPSSPRSILFKFLALHYNRAITENETA